ncbi:MAG: MotA/TolQ/ExbB proton channel family protein [Planctomycetota bacterium]
MTRTENLQHRLPVRLSIVAALMVSLLAAVAWGQTDSPEPAGIVDAAELESVMSDNNEAVAANPSDQPSGIDLLTLIARGGSFMIPIGLMSMLVVTLAVERALSMRTGKVIPRRLLAHIEGFTRYGETVRPSDAIQVCRKLDSPAGRVIASMLMRTGQPLGEIERAATETAQREADRCAAPIRWLNLAAAATPLMGLLGTVWGMIVAFHESTTLSADQSRSEQLSEGIYTALVTTLAGLAVAIPAAILAQYLENRVTKLFHRIEQVAFQYAPGLLPYAGVSRLDPDGTMHSMSSAGATPNLQPPAAPPTKVSVSDPAQVTSG